MKSKPFNLLPFHFPAILFLFSFFCLLSSRVYSADVSSRDTAGVEQERFEKEKRLDKQTRDAQSELREEEPVVEETEQKPSGVSPDVTFRLREVQVTGNEKISSDELIRLARDFIGRDVRLDDLNQIASRMKQDYRQKGFLAAYVFLPPQDVTAGRVEFRVIEGRLGQIEVKGNRWFSARVIRRMLNLGSGQVLFYRDLRAGLDFLNKKRNLKAKAILKPGEAPQTTDLEILVKDRFPVHLATDVNNLGTKNTGRTRWGISLTHENLLGQMDEAEGSFQIGKGAWAAGARYLVPIHPSGTAAGFSYAHSAVDVGGEFKALNVKGDASAYGLELLQPVIRGRAFDAGLNLGFDFKNVENRIGGRVSGKDKLRILNTGLDLDETDAWGKTYFPQSFHFGFSDFLGASHKIDSRATRENTGGQFFIYRSSLLRFQRLPLGMALVSHGALQLTPDRLPPSEEFRVGGAFSVRGYPEGEYLADNGAYLSNEVRIPAYFFPASWKLPFSKEPLRDQIEEVAFYDFGGGAVQNPAKGENEDKFLAGAGGGIRIHLFDKVYGRFQWAGRIGSKSTEGANSAFYYGISAEIL